MRYDFDDPINLAIFRKWFANANFDPTGGLLTMGVMAVGSAMSAAGTIAGGAAAKQGGLMQQSADEFQAEQAEQNAAQAFASGQRTALDTALKARMAMSRSTAVAAAGGVNAGVGSPVTNIGEIEQRGSYEASTDLFNGQSKATGLLNEAKGFRYSGEIARIGGEEAQEASYLTAAGTLAGGAGGAFKTYANWGKGF